MTIAPSFPPTNETVTSWTVHVQQRDPQDHTRGMGAEHSSTHLAAARAVRHHIAHTADHVLVTRIIQHTRVVTTRSIELADLPGPGQPTPPPAVPNGAYQALRHYRFLRCGPYVLRNGDAVRHWHEQAEQNPYIRHELLRLLEVTTVRYQRQVAPRDLPACPCCPP
jgi:hypothetical protein